MCSSLLGAWSLSNNSPVQSVTSCVCHSCPCSLLECPHLLSSSLIFQRLPPLTLISQADPGLMLTQVGPSSWNMFYPDIVSTHLPLLKCHCIGHVTLPFCTYCGPCPFPSSLRAPHALSSELPVLAGTIFSCFLNPGIVCFETGLSHVAQAGLEVAILVEDDPELLSFPPPK